MFEPPFGEASVPILGPGDHGLVDKQRFRQFALCESGGKTPGP